MQEPKEIIAFYNLENFFDTKDDPHKNDNDYLPHGSNHWTENRYLGKVEGITAAIESIQPEKLPIVIGVAEIENSTVLKDLIYQPAFKGEYKYVHFDSPDRRGIDVALLYNQNLVQILESEKIPVRINGNSHFATRDILYVKAKIKQDNVHFFVNHWPSRGEGIMASNPKRVAAAECLHNKAKQILNQDKEAKILIMGDFNDLPVSKSISKHLQAKAHKNITEQQFYNLAAIPYQKKMGSLFAKKHWLMFDQIIISKGLLTGKGIRISAPRLTIHGDRSLLYFDQQAGIYKPNRTYTYHTYHGGASDHLPVYVALD
ncbi:hypothetical protein [Marinifilum caeruleilacunae]|uniref:Endonuclease/exonuclease/phosphatase domain-containing protein n=1 Tax=Marinifilum caeruleilacunae TaxID=2499076 RepID=A0ABX1WXY1_9BACT|nr:hypothetical protein [Marinifilum caeruleilacunae]NOU60766.1 hypothetical protein [Marinifilum caeruleilacunae]